MQEEKGEKEQRKMVRDVQVRMLTGRHHLQGLFLLAPAHGRRLHRIRGSFALWATVGRAVCAVVRHCRILGLASTGLH